MSKIMAHSTAEDGGSIPTVQTDGPAALVQQVEDRRALLLATADLFGEISTFMESITPRTFADYEAATTEAQKAPLRQKHREAMRIRDDYKWAAKENRDDAAFYAELLACVANSPGSGPTGDEAEGEVNQKDAPQ